MKVIVFGGSGFVGSHVADALSESGHDVVIYDAQQSAYLRKNQKMIVGDILDEAAVTKAMKGCDYVYNFAGMSSLDGSKTKPMDTVTQNIQGTVILLEACHKNNVKRFIYASTVYVYSERGGFYRCSKQAAELYIEEYQRRYGLNYTILRYGTVYGPRANEHNSIHRYLSQALNEKKITATGTGDEMREYIYIKDAAELSASILQDKHVNKHIIITGHHPMKFKDFLNMIKEILGNNIKIDLQPGAKDDSTHYSMTPYSFTPKIGYKLTSNCYLDMGQGLLECIDDINHQQK